MRYLLDTNVVSDLVRRPQGPVVQRIRQTGEARVCTSILVAAELRFDAEKRGSARLTAQVEAVLGVLDVLPLEAPADAVYGALRARLERMGQPIGGNDLLIAAHGCPRLYPGHRQRAGVHADRGAARGELAEMKQLPSPAVSPDGGPESDGGRVKWPLPSREMPIHPPPANRPEGRPLAPAALRDGRDQADRSRCQEAAGQRARTPSAARLQGRQAREGPLVGGARSAGGLVCVTVYKRGAVEVVRRLAV